MVLNIPRKKEFQKKLLHLQKEGANNLHIISDFDKTLTKAYVHGKRAHSTYALLREGNYMGKEYVEKAYALHDRYYPYEISPTLSLEEKKEKMQEWWRAHMRLLLHAGMNKKIIKIIAHKKPKERKGLSEFFMLLAKKNIPLLIFSAGLGDVIKMYLEKQNLLTKNVHILANFYRFNKNEIEVKHHPYHKEIEHRKNVILKIGFLNEKDKELKREYAKHFDMLILNDGTMEGVNRLLKMILCT